MKSSIEYTFVFDEKGTAHYVPKELPNYCGIESIGYVWHGEWADPEIEYKGKRCSVYQIEDTMWSYYVDECADATEDKFAQYMKEHEDEVIELCENMMGKGGN